MDQSWITKLPGIEVVAVVVVLMLFIRRYVQGGTFSGKETLQGRTVIITGANTGLGKVTAIELAKRGGRIIMACRNMTLADAAREDVCKASGSSNVFVRKLDLASRASIIEFVKGFLKDEEKLDLLINNAGVMWCPRLETEDGYELQLGVNHLGHFLLTNLLLERLKSAAPSRVVTVSSMGHAMGSGRMNFDDLNSEESYSKYGAYFQSKLANVLFTKELAKRLKGTGVTTYSLHPGAIFTELSRYIPGFGSKILRMLCAPIVWLTLKTQLQGAQTTIHCALDSGLAAETGLYYSDCKVKEPVKSAYDEEAARTLWIVSEKWMKLSAALEEIKS